MTMRALYVFLLLVFIGSVFGKAMNDKSNKASASECSNESSNNQENQPEESSGGILNTLGSSSRPGTTENNKFDSGKQEQERPGEMATGMLSLPRIFRMINRKRYRLNDLVNGMKYL